MSDRKHVTRFRLVQSMRDRLDQPFSQTVRAIGEGFIPPVTLPDDSVVIALRYSPQQPSDVTRTLSSSNSPSPCSIAGVDTFQQLVDFFYPDILNAESPHSHPEEYWRLPITVQTRLPTISLTFCPPKSVHYSVPTPLSKSLEHN